MPSAWRAIAPRASGIYEAEVPVNSQTDTERDNGFARALAQVMAKISGDRTATGRPGVGQELRRAKDYVAGYDYRQDQGVSATGAPTFKHHAGGAVRPGQGRQASSARWACRSGRSRGPSRCCGWRSTTARARVWSASRQSNAARAVLDRAMERGYRLGLPDRQRRRTGRGRRDLAQRHRRRSPALSARYSPPMQLIGKLYRKGNGWKADWIFVDGGRELSKWSTENSRCPRARCREAPTAPPTR